jgi:hypothetical protein
MANELLTEGVPKIENNPNKILLNEILKLDNLDNVKIRFNIAILNHL